ncbi:MAG TPA: SLC13 family permease [Pseudonocardia sp.]|uniref:SLC13 family permease n=1 Tax=Pseudonocardia sp. TaxID=60912 RepID=UPI002C408FBC|nr:SLC13 family permease [Pseudonocardia sp.]HTF51895.1 SLC13 family permease [Pseudonocardia sp.]
MSSPLLATLVLLAVFVIGTVLPVNLGALALIAAILVGPAVLGQSVKDVLGGFPADLFVLIFGVTYLFSIATVNGTIERLVERCARLVDGRRALLPVMLFVVSAVPTSLGALAPASVAMLAPVALRLAHRYQVSAKLAALMVLYGSTAGNFSPLNPLGAIVNGTMVRVGLPTDPVFLYLVSFLYNVGIGALIFCLGGGLVLLREARQGYLVSAAIPAAVGSSVGTGSSVAPGPAAPPDDAPDTGSGSGGPGSGAPAANLCQVVTLLCLLGVAVLALGFRLDVGVCALGAAVGLNLLFPRSSEGATKYVSWNVILLICGIVTYVEMLERTGTLDMLGRSLIAIGWPLLAILLVLAVGALSSAFASSAGILGAMVPIMVPLIVSSGGSPVAIITALAICVTVVDASPFSSIGALALSNARESDRNEVQGALLRWCGAMVVTAPLITGLALVVPAL